MQSPDPPRPIYRFGDFEFEPRTAELRRQGRKVRLREQPAQILTLLLARPGDLVTREEARQALWPGDTFVDFDVGLNSAVKRLRDALDDSAEQPRFVETLPRRGYRFIAPVEAPAPATEPAPAPAVAAAHLPSMPARDHRFRAIVSLTAVAVILLVLALGVMSRRRPAEPPGPAPITSIAVLPFENLSGDREQDYFADGMTDSLITRLAQVRALRVISRTSVTQYTQKDKLLPRIAADLNVDAVVEGTVVRSGNRVRVTAQLIHAPTDRHLWASTYERELRDVIALQGELAGAIAEAVHVELRPEEQRRLAARGAVDPEAYDAYLKGRFFWNRRSPQDLAKAAQYFEQAIATDPAYAPAYSGLSDTYRLSGPQGLRPRDSMPKAEAAARQALALDDTLAEAHASLAGVLYRYHWDWEGAEREFRRSLELDPSYAEGHRAYAIYLMTVRRHEEAITELRRARELSPLSPVINVELAGALGRSGHYDEAIQQVQKALEIDPKMSQAYATLAAIHDKQGDYPKAIAALEKAAALSGRGGGAWLGYLYAVSGRRREAQAMVAVLQQRSRQQYVSPQHLAIVHLGLGDDDKAFALLEKAYEERAFEVLGFSGRLYDRLRDDPRFQDLLRRMKLPTAAPLPARG
jgi:TolB-like protein/DNA-binding winged helix-turn-helix (wHTH) protein/tetratricopeptide (TPR) repeat protein